MSKGELLLVDLPLDKLVPSLQTDVLGFVTANVLDDFQKLLVFVAVLQLVVDVTKVFKFQDFLALHVQQIESGFTADLTEW